MDWRVYEVGRMAESDGAVWRQPRTRLPDPRPWGRRWCAGPPPHSISGILRFDAAVGVRFRPRRRGGRRL